MKNLFYRKLNGMAGLKEKTSLKIRAFAGIVLMFVAFLTISAITNDAGKGAMIAPFIGLAAIKRDPNSGMESSEKAAHDALIATVKTQISEAVAKKVDTTELEAIKTQLENLSKFDSEAVKAEVTRLANELAALKEAPKAPKEGFKSRIEAIKAALNENLDVIKGAFSSDGKLKHPIMIEMKSAITMQEDNTIGAGATQYTITSNTGIISTIRKRSETYLAAVSVGSLDGNQALWIEETDEQGAPIMLGEGDAATQLSVRYEEKTKDVKEISVYGKVTNRMLEDLSLLATYINNNLEKRMDLKVEDQLFSGNNTGDNLAGLEGYATAFSAGAMANAVEKANEWDVLEAVATQVELAYGSANAIFVHPSTIQAMKAVKSTTGEPLWKYYQDATSPSGMSVAGMKIISTPAMTAGNFLGGDLTAVNVLFRQNTTVQIGTDGNDLIQRKKTIVYTKRLVQFVSANETGLLVTGDFASAKAALLSV